MIVPSCSATTKRKTISSAGIRISRTSNWPSSTPALNENNDVNRCDPANCSVWRSANENPKPWTSPNANVTSQRRRNAEAADVAENIPLGGPPDGGIPVDSSATSGELVDTKVFRALCDLC